MDEELIEVLPYIIIIVLAIFLLIASLIYARHIGVRGLCPNCGQRQTGWSTQCIRCGVVFKEWKE